MQKSQRGLMRSAKQQKRKQKLFALCNNNNPINCRRLPGLPLLEPCALKLAYCRWFCPRRLAPNHSNQEAWLRLNVPSLSRSGTNGEKGTNRKTQVAHINHWEPEMDVWDGIWGERDLPSRREVNLRLAKSITAKLRLCMWKDDQPSLFRGYKIILMIKIHHLAGPL